jgi:hypothetical protein
MTNHQITVNFSRTNTHTSQICLHTALALDPKLQLPTGSNLSGSRKIPNFSTTVPGAKTMEVTNIYVTPERVKIQIGKTGRMPDPQIRFFAMASHKQLAQGAQTEFAKTPKCNFDESAHQIVADLGPLETQTIVRHFLHTTSCAACGQLQRTLTHPGVDYAGTADASDEI